MLEIVMYLLILDWILGIFFEDLVWFGLVWWGILLLLLAFVFVFFWNRTCLEEGDVALVLVFTAWSPLLFLSFNLQNYSHISALPDHFNKYLKLWKLMQWTHEGINFPLHFKHNATQNLIDLNCLKLIWYF